MKGEKFYFWGCDNYGGKFKYLNALLLIMTQMMSGSLIQGVLIIFLQI